MNRLGFGILIPFSKSVVLSSITHLRLAIASNSHCSISIALRHASTITYTFVSCHTSTCTSVDNCCFVATTFSSLVSFYTVYASTKCCSTILSSFNSSMNTRFTNVTPNPTYFFTCQHHLLNCRCSSCVYVLNYRLNKLYLLLTRLPSCTF
jgi:hypothetical protein